jgi:hypothetical protein
MPDKRLTQLVGEGITLVVGLSELRLRIGFDPTIAGVGSAGPK